MARRMRIVATAFSAVGWVALVLGVALCASGLLHMLDVRGLPDDALREAAFEVAALRWYRGLAVLLGSPLMFLLGGAASALAIYHDRNERREADSPVP